MPKHKTTPTFTTEGLGTRWIIELINGETDFPPALAKRLKAAITSFDENYSRFKEHSFFCQLNRYSVLLKPPKELVDMFAFAHKMHTATEGAFDISVGGSLQELGYGTPSKAKGIYPGFWQETAYSTDELRIPIGAAVDLGGYGKGWLIDMLGVLLEQEGHPYYVIYGGGDILVSAKQPIELGLEHPYDPQKIIGTTHIKNGSLAVSSIVKRRWVKDGTSYHHIIDPATNKPSSNGVVTTYVKGASALIADTLSTIILLLPDLETKLRAQFSVETIILKQNQLI